MLASRRPIAVWVILAASIYVFGIAVWGFRNLVTSPPYDDMGLLGYAVLMLAPVIVLIAGLSMFALTKWAILPTVLTALMFVLAFYWTEDALQDVTMIVSTLASLAVVSYAIWLRRKGILK
jgi:hypothetical protein